MDGRAAVRGDSEQTRRFRPEGRFGVASEGEAMSGQWYFRLLNEEFGPVPQTAIGEMVSDGRLGPEDVVRREWSETWVPVGSLEFPEDQPGEPEELHDLAELDFQLVSSSAATKTNSAAEPQELHDLSELDIQFVDSRQAAPQSGPERHREDLSPVADYLETDELDMLLSDDDIPVRDSPRIDGPVPPSAPLPQLADAGTTGNGTAAKADAERPEPRPAASGPGGRRGESLLAAALAETANAGPRPRRRATRGVRTSLTQVSPLLLAVLAVCVLTQGWRWLGAGGRDAAADYSTLSAHYQELLKLREQTASPTQWKEFEERVRADLVPMVEQWEGMTTSKEPEEQQILFAARDGLLKMVDESPREPSVAEAREFVPAMREAHSLLGDAELPDPPNEIAAFAQKGPIPRRPEPATEESSKL